MMSKDNYLTVVTVSFTCLCSLLAAQILPVENSRPAHEAGLLQGVEADQEEPF